ncbi:MAG TPA: type I-C CRISPR-associated endonuclease Cas1c [Tepidisphaeraceae bacterium]|jgi:CRISPR-associated protein Cas1|nr:type I-C CRISPR-associated endonuclease Cas1c [Tepidisphaeraceae bacterium]
MKHHLNTLFIQTQGTYLAKEGEAVLVKVDKKVLLRVPVHNLGGIVCFGRVGLSASLMGLCGERGVAISMLSESGMFRARINGFTSGNVLLRRQQYRLTDDSAGAASIARAIVSAKVANGRSVLLRTLRDNSDLPGKADVDAAARRMAMALEQLQPPLPSQTAAPLSLDSVRGLEGEAANTYFGVFDHLIIAQKPEPNREQSATGASAGFAFRTRSRRPPLDAVNALLSFLYAMLGHDARSACECVGLDPQVGFLHRDRPGRAGLGLDLMEEFRPYLADRLALSLINRRQVSPAGFTVTESGAVSMDDATRKAVISAYQKRKQEQVVHPYLGEKVSVGLLIHLQARLMARHIRGELDAYPAFIWK